MIAKFNHYNLIIEKLGINLDIENISEYIFSIIKNNNSLIINIDGSLLKTKEIKIKNIKINVYDFDFNGSFDISSSKITTEGLLIVININKNNISKKLIHHELNHALEFYMVGKEKYIEKSHKLDSHLLSKKFINNEYIEVFTNLFYYSESTEINSRIPEDYYDMLDKFRVIGKMDIKTFNKYFSIFKKESESYKIAEDLLLFNFDQFKKLNSDNLIIFFNILDDRKELLKIRRTSGSFTKFLTTLKIFLTGEYFNNLYYKTIDKNIKIENLDNILNIYSNRFKKSANKYIEKIDKLYDVLLDKLKEENLISFSINR